MPEEVSAGNNPRPPAGPAANGNGQGNPFAVSAPPVQPQDQTEREALANLLRSRELQAALLGGVDRVDISTAVNMPAAQAVFDTVQSLYDRDHQLPSDPSVLIVEVERRLRDTDEWSSQAGEQVGELVRWCFGGDSGTVSAERGRELWSELIRSRLLAFRLRNASTNVITSPAATTTAMRALSGLWDWLRAFERGEQTQRLRSYSMADLFELARPPEWLVEPLIVRGANAYIGGPFKSLKSGISLDLAVSLAVPSTGGQRTLFLNRFPCEPARHVLVFTGEAGMWEVRQRIELIYRSKCILPRAGSRRHADSNGRPTDALNLHVVFDASKMSVTEDQRFVREEIRRHEADVVIFDPLYLCALGGTDADASNVFEMGTILRDMDGLLLDEGATPIFLHHFTKNVKVGAKPKLGDMAFAGSAERAAQWILLNHRVPFDSETGHARLMMEVGGRAGQCGSYGLDLIEGRVSADFTGRRWQPDVTGLAEALDRDRQAGVSGGGADRRDPEQQRREADEEAAGQILNYLTEHPDGDVMSNIRGAVRHGADRIQPVLDRLVAEGRVVRGQVRRQRRGYEGYRLATNGNGQSRQQNNLEE